MMNESITTIPIKELLSTKSRFLFLISELTEKKKKLTYEKLMEEALEMFIRYFKNERTAKQRLAKILTEFEAKGEIIVTPKNGERYVTLKTKIPYKIVNISRIISIRLMRYIAIIGWVMFIISWLTLNVGAIVTSLISAILITIGFITNEPRFVLNMRTLEKEQK